MNKMRGDEPVEDLFSVIPNENVAKEETQQRLREFCYYFTHNIEANLQFCLALLEERNTSKKTNSNPITALSGIVTPIPYLGKALSTAVKEGEIFIANKIDIKNSRVLADIVYCFNDSQENFRQMLIDAAAEIFFCFENQFVRLNCDGGPRRAMHKLAKDAAARIFSYLLENGQNGIVKEDFSKGLLFGNSTTDNLGRKVGKTVKSKELKWKTSSIYTKVGFFADNKFFGTEKTKSGKYGYRRLFSWENIDRSWTGETCTNSPKYQLSSEAMAELTPTIKEYIMKKNIHEEAQLDRSKKHQDLMDDIQNKHDSLNLVLTDNFDEICNNLARNYSEIKSAHEQNLIVERTLKQQQIIQEERHREVSVKLDEISATVMNVKQEQEILKTEVTSVQKQESVTTIHLSKSNVVRQITKLAEDVAHSRVEQRVKKEVSKSFKKIFK